jgi:uncharacterized protein YdeI (YjbR/CyaY-like superfamily)
MEVGERLTVRNRDEWRRWLARHHQDRKEIWLVYNKKSSGKGGITYDESVEEALCFGWIDGQIKTLDESAYAGRFTPRRAGSNWSPSNLQRLERLLAADRMAPAGLALLPPGLKRPKQRA